MVVKGPKNLDMKAFRSKNGNYFQKEAKIRGYPCQLSSFNAHH